MGSHESPYERSHGIPRVPGIQGNPWIPRIPRVPLKAPLKRSQGSQKSRKSGKSGISGVSWVHWDPGIPRSGALIRILRIPGKCQKTPPLRPRKGWIPPLPRIWDTVGPLKPHPEDPQDGTQEVPTRGFLLRSGLFGSQVRR